MWWAIERFSPKFKPHIHFSPLCLVFGSTFKYRQTRHGSGHIILTLHMAPASDLNGAAVPLGRSVRPCRVSVWLQTRHASGNVYNFQLARTSNVAALTMGHCVRPFRVSVTVRKVKEAGISVIEQLARSSVFNGAAVLQACFVPARCH